VQLVCTILRMAYGAAGPFRIKEIYDFFRAKEFILRDQTYNRKDSTDDTPEQRKKLKYFANNRRDLEKKDREKSAKHSKQYTKPKLQMKDDARRWYEWTENQHKEIEELFFSLR